jgi:hypothetical protein
MGAVFFLYQHTILHIALSHSKNIHLSKYVREWGDDTSMQIVSSSIFDGTNDFWYPLTQRSASDLMAFLPSFFAR